MNSLKSLFLLDPGVIFLNHGSFGATPEPVFQQYQEWQLLLERQPVKFLGREIFDLLRTARRSLGEYLGADAENLVYLPNATHAVNLVGRSLDLKAGDEILVSNHEYGACENLWTFLSEKNGFKIKRAEIPLPLPPAGRTSELIWSQVTERTRLIFLSQISSPTAVRLPVEEICQRARERDILVFIDGAHGPGQEELSLEELGADFYAGNCHKWLLAPKGSAFLYTRPDRQSLLDPLVVGWGWGKNSPFQGDTRYLQQLEWQGTRDMAAYLSVPAAIEFQREHDWPRVREMCRRLLAAALEEIQSLSGLPALYGDEGGRPAQMGAAELPPDCQPERLQGWLYEQHRIEIPVISWEGRWLIRLSVQAYNEKWELEKLLDALKEYLPAVA